MQLASIVIALFLSSATNAQPLDIPGYNRAAIDTMFSRGLRLPIGNGNSINGGLVVGRPNEALAAPTEAFLRVPTDDGDTVLVPKGIYHYSDKEDDVKGELLLPDIDNPIGWLAQMLKGNTDVKSTDRTTNGVYIPLPFGMQPINFQLTTHDTDGVGVDGGVGAHSVNEPDPSNNFFARTLLDSLHSTHDSMRRQRSANALQFAREVCIYYDQTACDAALERYANIRDGHLMDTDVRRSEPNDRGDRAADQGADFATRLTYNLMDVMVPVLDRGISKLTSEPSTLPIAALGGGREKKLGQKGVGMLLGFPGIDPLYVGGFLNNDKSTPFNVGIAPR